jgi:hypothetical protein
MLTRPRNLTRLVLALLMLVVMGSAAAAQESSKSAVVAKQLAQALDAAKLTAIAAKDPGDPDAFVAAMYFSGSQLLVVSAKYQPAVLVAKKLENKEYQDIYIDLNSAAVAGTKVFFEDAGADGLQAEHDNGKPFDSYEKAGKRTMFDDAWRKDQKMSEDAFKKVWAEADAAYATLLQALLAQAKK